MSNNTTTCFVMIVCVIFVLYAATLCLIPTFTRSQNVDSMQVIQAATLDVVWRQQIMDAFVTEMASHSYTDWNDDVVVDNHTFERMTPSLLLNAVANHTVFLYGDSSNERWRSFLLDCLHFYANATYNASLSMFNGCRFESSLLSSRHNFNGVWFPADTSNLTCWTESGLNRTCWTSNLTSINSQLVSTSAWAYHGRSSDDFLQFYTDLLTTYKPDVIYFNPVSQHLHQLFPVRPFEKNAVDFIQHLQEHFLTIYNAAASIDAKCVLYRSSFPLCYSLDDEEHSAARSVWLGKSGPLFSNYSAQCTAEYEEQLCEQWAWTNEGIQHFNALMRQFVKEAQHGKYGNYTSVYYYDGYNLMHSDPEICQKETNDFLHWPRSYGANAMYFANFVKFVC